MQVRSLAELWKLSLQFPSEPSGLKRITIEDVFDEKDIKVEDIWWRGFVPEVCG